jgi:parvulin-like peptidyl-prolyl isomerase
VKRMLSFFILFIFLSAWSYADDTIVAKVNNTAITATELEETVNRLIPRATYHGSVSEEKRAEYREKALEGLINQELQYQDALARSMKPDKKKVKDRMEEIKNRFKSKKEYKAALEQAGITEDVLKARAEKSILIEAAIAKTVTETSQITEETLKDYYSKNPSKFKQPESVRLRIISVKDEKKAKEIVTKLKAGEDFSDLAAKMSEDDYRIMGGDIGYVHKGRIFQELEEAAFRKLKVGQMSGMIKAENTWFIVRLEDKKPEYQMTFDEIKDKLKKELEAKRSAELMEKWIADLRSKAKIGILMKM